MTALQYAEEGRARGAVGNQRSSRIAKCRQAKLSQHDLLCAREDAVGLQRQEGQVQISESAPHPAPRAEHKVTTSYSSRKTGTLELYQIN